MEVWFRTIISVHIWSNASSLSKHNWCLSCVQCPAMSRWPDMTWLQTRIWKSSPLGVRTWPIEIKMTQNRYRHGVLTNYTTLTVHWYQKLLNFIFAPSDLCCEGHCSAWHVRVPQVRRAARSKRHNSIFQLLGPEASEGVTPHTHLTRLIRFIPQCLHETSENLWDTEKAVVFVEIAVPKSWVGTSR